MPNTWSRRLHGRLALGTLCPLVRIEDEAGLKALLEHLASLVLQVGVEL